MCSLYGFSCMWFVPRQMSEPLVHLTKRWSDEEIRSFADRWTARGSTARRIHTDNDCGFITWTQLRSFKQLKIESPLSDAVAPEKDSRFSMRFESDLQALWVGLEGAKNPSGMDGLALHESPLRLARKDWCCHYRPQGSCNSDKALWN